VALLVFGSVRCVGVGFGFESPTSFLLFYLIPVLVVVAAFLGASWQRGSKTPQKSFFGGNFLKAIEKK
jgi:hypothetical protein